MTRALCGENSSGPPDIESGDLSTNVFGGRTDRLGCKGALRQYLAILGVALYLFLGPVCSALAETSDTPAQNALGMNDFIADAVKLQEATNGESHKAYISIYRGTSALLEHADLFSDCEVLDYSVFAHKYEMILSKIVHSPEDFPDLFTDREQEEILMDPRKIAVLVDYVLSRPISTTILEASGMRTATEFNQALWQNRERESECNDFETERKQRGLIK